MSVGLYEAQAQDPSFISLQCRVQELFEANKEAVVRIKGLVKKQAAQGEDPSYIWTASSGFFITPDGYVLASSSVAEGGEEFWIEFQGVMYPAELKGVETMTGLALFKLKMLPEKAKCLYLTSGVNDLALGSLAVSISYPFNLGATPSFGIVGGQDGEFLENLFSTYYWRVNIPTSRGEAGAPVVDIDGRLIGIRVVSLPEMNSTYVLPVRAIERVIDDLKYQRPVSYGYVGMEAKEIDIGKSTHRVVVNRILVDSPASKAGIRVGDQLVGFGEFTINTMADVRNAAFFARVDQYVTVKLLRMGKPISVSVRVAKPPVNASQLLEQVEGF